MKNNKNLLAYEHFIGLLLAAANPLLIFCCSKKGKKKKGFKNGQLFHIYKVGK